MNKPLDVNTHIYQHTVTLKSGRLVSLFVNKITGLVIVDVVRKDERGGCEVVRMNANLTILPTTAELDRSDAQLEENQ